MGPADLGGADAPGERRGRFGVAVAPTRTTKPALVGACCALLAAAVDTAPAAAQVAQPAPASGSASALAGADPAGEESPRFRSTVRAAMGAPGRASSTVSRTELEERLPRSAPDALRYEPGVYVQQTAHGQGSAYLRGLTGQQTVMLFDGVRLNNSLYRQGPNQYFFTIDSRTIEQIVVQRGAASVRYGSDALGGAIEAIPISPDRSERPPDRSEQTAPGSLRSRVVLHPMASMRLGSADGEAGGRLQLSGWLGSRVGILVGGGYRKVGPLIGLPVQNPDQSVRPYPEVPRYLEDGVTQRGTGFSEGTADARIVIPLGARDGSDQLVLAVYQYLQTDAPRTDQCPAAFAPLNECLIYEEQFRTLAYSSLRLTPGRAALHRFRATLSYQLQHEKRRRDRPLDHVVEHFGDDVHSLGVALRAETQALSRGPLRLLFRYGTDLYHDRVSSDSSLEVQDLGFTRVWSRGQYITGSHYTTFGAFAEAESQLWRRLTLRLGGRSGVTAVHVPADPESATRPADALWVPYAVDAGVELRVIPQLVLLGNLNQGFRTPNLDDLSSRQVTGPGYQFENASLRPEIALTVEAGARLTLPVLSVSAFFFNTGMTDAIARSPRNIADCPLTDMGRMGAPGCSTAWSRFQLVNLGGRAVIWGGEADVLLHLPLRMDLRATVAYAFGEGPNPTPPAPGQARYVAIVPLSRIPPLNGTAELRVRPLRGILLGAALRWALAQDRLAPSDLSDARIPSGGTPGFAVFDVRAGARLHELLPGRFLRRAVAMLVLENAGDVAYRYHGSSVNGARSSVQFNLEIEI